MKSIIGIKEKDQIEYITLENGGNIEEAGKLLILHYYTKKSIKNLLSYGDISTLQAPANQHTFENPQYGPALRRRKAGLIKNPRANSVQELCGLASQNNVGICYIYHTDKRQWRAYPNPFHPEAVSLRAEGTDGVDVAALFYEDHDALSAARSDAFSETWGGCGRFSGMSPVAEISFNADGGLSYKMRDEYRFGDGEK